MSELTDEDVVRDALHRFERGSGDNDCTDAFAALDRLTARLAQAEQERDEWKRGAEASYAAHDRTMEALAQAEQEVGRIDAELQNVYAERDEGWNKRDEAWAKYADAMARVGELEGALAASQEYSKFREEQALDRYRDRNKARNALNAATDRVAELEGALAEAQRLTKDWNHPNADAIADLGHPTKDEPRTTKTGRVLTDADFEQLADEAEQGYDVDHVVERPPKDEA